ncbi:Two-component response regulator ORR23, partial [Mucuna pruriens]
MAKILSDDNLPHQFPAGLTILAIDNDPAVIESIRKMCSRCHYNVFTLCAVSTCCESPVALKILRERKDCADVILMEVHMPEIDGFEFLEHARKEINVPIISV